MIERQRATWTVVGRVRIARYHDLPDTSVSYATVEILGGQALAEAWHRHGSAEDVFVLDGLFELQVAGEADKRLEPMTHCRISMGCSHRLRSNGGLAEVFVKEPQAASANWVTEPGS